MIEKCCEDFNKHLNDLNLSQCASIERRQRVYRIEIRYFFPICKVWPHIPKKLQFFFQFFCCIFRTYFPQCAVDEWISSDINQDHAQCNGAKFLLKLHFFSFPLTFLWYIFRHSNLRISDQHFYKNTITKSLIIKKCNFRIYFNQFWNLNVCLFIKKTMWHPSFYIENKHEAWNFSREDY